MRSLGRHLSYANVISTVCLFVLLGGGAAYAASQLPKNSVGAKQLKKGAVTGVKIKDGTITGAKINSRTLGIVPAAASADHATSAGTADRATTAGSADKATTATFADNAALLEGTPAGGFVSSGQVGYIDRLFVGCSLAILCDEELLEIGTVTVRAICETAAGTSSISLYPLGADESGYSFVRGTTEARHGQFNGSQSFAVVTTTSSEAVGATGTLVMRTAGRIITLSFDVTARAPTVNTAACTLHATALAV